MQQSRICLALDGLTAGAAIRLTENVGHLCHAVKIHDLYDAAGGDIVEQLMAAGAARVWVDVKIHDIPITAANRAREIAGHGAKIITAHASGGVRMIEAITDELAEHDPDVSLFAISVLTSLGQEETARIYGKDRTLEQIVFDFAHMAKEAGAQGIVCSPKEIGMLSGHPYLKGLQLIAPGVRSIGKNAGDQKRVGTPKQAIDDGASFIVVGRQVVEAEDPVAAFDAIAIEIGDQPST